jgi:hypothetical protein
MTPGLPNSELLKALRGTLASDAVLEVTLGDIAEWEITNEFGSAGNLYFLGQSSGDIDVDAECYVLAPGDSSGRIIANDRKVRLRRAPGLSVNYLITRVGRP